MTQGIAPWWQRGWQDWWANQKTTLAVEDPDGRLTYDESRHEARWRGRIAATSGRWMIEIRWGAGTPYFPPLVYPDGQYSSQHQLRDGSLCLAPPSFTEVVEVAEWLKQTRSWIDRYVGEAWGVTREEWLGISLFRPDPGYRLHARPHSYILMPFRWNPTAERGEFSVSLPRAGKGLGVLRRWRPDGQRAWEEWDQGNPYVPSEVDEVRGHWYLTSSSKDFQKFESYQRSFMSRNRSSLIAFPIIHDQGMVRWQFALYEPSKFLQMKRKLQQSRRGAPPTTWVGEFLSLILSHTIIEGLPMQSDALTMRTRVSRSETADDRIRNGCVVLVGQGALGSEVAHLLAKEQVGRFVLIDDDLLLPGNVARHRLDLNSVGGNKAEQMKLHIMRNHPAAEVSVVPAMLDEALPDIDFPQDAIVIGVTGHIPSERVLSAISAQRQAPCLHAWMECGGRILRLLRAVPGRDPSLTEIAELPPLPDSQLKPQPEECAGVVLAGSASNIHAAANLVARTALDLLCCRFIPENHILFSPDGFDEPGDELPAALRQRYGMSACKLQKNF